jgi:hypothetical protein
MKGEIKDMKSYQNFMEAHMSWGDVKNRDIKKAGEKKKQKLKGKEVLAYSAEHGEFSTFKDPKELEDAQKGSKGKAMKWIKVEGWLRDEKGINEKFDFKAAVKLGMLERSDEKYFKDLEEKKWNVHEFNITSKGFELTIRRGSRSEKFTGKNPEDALKMAAKKVR